MTGMYSTSSSACCTSSMCATTVLCRRARPSCRGRSQWRSSPRGSLHGCGPLRPVCGARRAAWAAPSPGRSCSRPSRGTRRSSRRSSWAAFAIGLGIGTAFMPLLTIAMADVPAEDAGLGSGIDEPVVTARRRALGLAVLEHHRREPHDMRCPTTTGSPARSSAATSSGSWPAPWSSRPGSSRPSRCCWPREPQHARVPAQFDIQEKAA